jgi:NACHT domain
MLDPLSAIGLAGNLITFVDFSTKALSRARKLYESASGATEENEELEGLTKNLKELAEKIQRRPVQIPQASPAHFSSESVLNGLTKQCVQVANELLVVLDSLKVKGDGGVLKSAAKAVKTLWKQDHLDGLQQRLDRISKQIADLIGLEQLEEINRRLRDMALENNRLEANRTKEIAELRRNFSAAVEDIKEGFEGDQMPTAWLILAGSASRGQALFAEQIILQCLKFSSIDSRQESISKEHDHTFSWIFNNSSSTRFVEWLKNEDGLYWISGKPGSGKSTLMKFLAAHGNTVASLKEWAGVKKLVTASFFFWNASTHRSQKSQQGLLRTILYQILRQCPNLIQEVYNDQWIAMISDSKVLKESRDEVLTIPALLKALRKISSMTESDTKFCFFIDGLDEYDGRPADIIELVDILKAFHNVKTCVSSRPWNDFEDRFGKDSPWKLYIQHFTRDDIQKYVEDTLGKHSRFQQLRKEDPKCPNFIRTIVNEADGVFLWVVLVVQSLMDGLTNSDRIKDLQDRLQETPSDLKDYFKTILFSTENRYRKQTARLFTVTVDCPSELPLMAYWVLDQENPDYFFECPAETPSLETLKARYDNMTRRLKVLSRGLLEVTTPFSEVEDEDTSKDELLYDYKVGFLHRTVKDYLQTQEARLMLQTWSEDDYNVDWEVCNAFGSLLKMIPPNTFKYTEEYQSEKKWEEIAMIFLLVYAAKIDLDPQLRDRLALMLEALQKPVGSAAEKHAPNFTAYINRSAGSLFLKGESVFEPDLAVLYGCVFSGLYNFVRDKFTREPTVGKRVTSSMATLYGTIFIYKAYRSEQFNIFPSVRTMPMMVELLLAHGADPNEKLPPAYDAGPDEELRESTEWQRLLTEVSLSDREEALHCFDVIRLLLRYGADFDQKFKPDRSDDILTARELLKDLYSADEYSVLEDIVRKRETKTARGEKISKTMRNFKTWMHSKSFR